MAAARGPIEAKAVAGPSTAAVAGYIAWAVITFVPWVRDNLPEDLQGQLPVVIGAALAAIVAYRAPHTSRPDLAPGEPQPVQLIISPDSFPVPKHADETHAAPGGAG